MLREVFWNISRNFCKKRSKLSDQACGRKSFCHHYSFKQVFENLLKLEEFYRIFGYVTRQNIAIFKKNTMVSVIADLKAVI